MCWVGMHADSDAEIVLRSLLSRLYEVEFTKFWFMQSLAPLYIHTYIQVIYNAHNVKQNG